MDIKIGDRVKFKESLVLGTGVKRRGEIGTVIAVHDNLPGQPHPRVDIEFADGGMVPGISVHQIEREPV